MIEPFKVSDSTKSVNTQYPEPDIITAALTKCSPLEFENFIRLWLTEGIPFAFKNIPIIYESMRGWLSKKLDIHPKQITVVGSARLGYSFSPYPKFGSTFGPNSDLDLTIISESLYQKYIDIYRIWEKEYSAGKVLPANPNEAYYWRENVRLIESTIKRGFIDNTKIPNRYHYAGYVANKLWVLKTKLEITPGAPEVKKLSIRIYRDWYACFGQLSLSVNRSIRSLSGL